MNGRREVRRRSRLLLTLGLAAGLLVGVLWSWHLFGVQERATENLTDLTPDELVEAIKSKPLVYVYFYSPT